MLPSKVLHVRGLPVSASATNLADVCHSLTVGDVVKTLIFIHKGQAFVEVDSENTAIEIVQSVAASPVMLHGAPLSFAFSHRRPRISSDMIAPPQQQLSGGGGVAPPYNNNSSSLDDPSSIMQVQPTAALGSGPGAPFSGIFSIFFFNDSLV